MAGLAIPVNRNVSYGVFRRQADSHAQTADSGKCLSSVQFTLVMYGSCTLGV